MSTEFTIVETYLFDTCTHRCGYCWLAESGQVLDTSQLDRFRDVAFVDQVAHFFNSRTTAERRWQFLFTGGEPPLAPNLDRLCDQLIDKGNRVAFYTALLLDEKHAGFRYLLRRSAPEVDYVMASFHPESELDEERQFRKVQQLKERGHNVIFRYVGHPARLSRLEHFAARCREADICFYPTTLFSNRYPAAYTEEQKERLSAHFTSFAQFIQLNGGLDTTATMCHAAGRLIAVNLQTGDITPCVTVTTSHIGNVFRNELQMMSEPIRCPQQGISCPCDVHFQQGIIIGAEDDERFAAQKRGFVQPDSSFQQSFVKLQSRLREMGAGFYQGTSVGIGDVADDSKLWFTKEEIKRNFRGMRAERSVMPIVRVELKPSKRAIIGGQIALDVETVSQRAIANVHGFINDAPDGTSNGTWHPLVIEKPWDGSVARMRVDTANLRPGTHRLGVNIDLSAGGTVYWYQQPAFACEVTAS